MTLREIDALIAEKVMGWQRLTHAQADPGVFDDDPEFANAVSSGWFDADRREIECWQAEDPDCPKEDWPRWAPTTNIEASRMLRDKLGEKFRWLLGSGSLTEGELPFGIGLYKKDTDELIDLFMAEANTEEMAVALVALRSIGIEAEIA